MGMSNATTDEREQIRVRLTEAGKRRADGREAATDAMREIDEAIRRGLALEPPMQPTELAHLSGVTRETVYQIKREVDRRLGK